jgi:DUF1680 family protein
MVRFLPEIGSVIYGKSADAIYVNQFIGSKANIQLANTAVVLVQKTDYPWSGKITLTVHPEQAGEFALHVRIPGWAQGDLLPGNLYTYPEDKASVQDEVVLKINGERIQQPPSARGYSVIERRWRKGDMVELELPMRVQVVTGNPRIEDTRGKGALMRGPIVYCIEEADNVPYFEKDATAELIPESLTPQERADLLDGVVVISGKAAFPDNSDQIAITAIPYYAWNNRGAGKMRVWLPVKMD